MKKWLLLALLFSSKSGFSQLEFFKKFGQPNLFEQLQVIRPAAEKGQFWAAGTTYSTGSADVFLVKIDTSGLVLWADTLGLADKNEELFDFDRDSTTGAILLTALRANAPGYEVVLTKIGPDGTVIFDAPMPLFQGNQDIDAAHVRALPDGGCVVARRVWTDHQIARVGPDGQIVWAKAITSNWSGGELNELAVAPDGSVFLAKRHGSTSESQIILHHFSASGDVLWGRVVQLAGNNLDGQPRSQAVIADPTDGAAIVAMRERANGGNGQWKNVFTKIDSTGQMVWQTAFQPTEPLSFERQLIGGPGGFFGLVFDEGFLLLDRATGGYVSEHDFFTPAGSTTNWGTSLLNGLISDDFELFLVGLTHSGDDFWTSDAQFIRMRLPSYDFLADAKIGAPGPADADGWPQLATDAAGNFFTANELEFGLPTGRDVVLRKFSPTGDLLFEKAFSESENVRTKSLVRLADGHLLLVGIVETPGTMARLFLKKIDPTDGTEIWEKQHPQTFGNYFNVSAQPMPDGGATVVFTRAFEIGPNQFLQNQPCAIRFSASGDTLWSRRYLLDATVADANASQRNIRNLETMADGSLVALGGRSMAYGFLLRIAPTDGELIAAFDVAAGIFPDARLESAVLATNGNLILYLDPRRIVRVSATTGAILKSEFVYFDSRSANLGQLFRMPDGRLGGLFSHNSSPTQSAGIRFAEFSEATLLASNVSEITPTSTAPTDFELLPDCSIAAAGAVQSLNSQDLFLLKTEPFCVVSATEAEPKKANEKAAFSVSPNPLGPSDFLKIELEDAAFFGFFSFEIWTLDGRLFSVFEKEKTTAKQVFEIEKPVPNSFRGGLPKGAFFVRVLTEKGSSQKLVLRF